MNRNDLLIVKASMLARKIEEDVVVTTSGEIVRAGAYNNGLQYIEAVCFSSGRVEVLIRNRFEIHPATIFRMRDKADDVGSDVYLTHDGELVSDRKFHRLGITRRQSPRAYYNYITGEFLNLLA